MFLPFFYLSHDQLVQHNTCLLACSWLLLLLLLLDDSSTTTCSSPTPVHMGAVAMKSSSQISHMYNAVAAAVRH
jgi:hypothetical protein